MRWHGIALLGLLLQAAPAAQGDWKDLTGRSVPEVSAAEWLNTGSDAPSIDSLKGKVWLLEFFATW